MTRGHDGGHGEQQLSQRVGLARETTLDNRNSLGLAGPALILMLLAALGLGPALRRSPAPASAPSPAGPVVSFSHPKVNAAAAEANEPNSGYEHGAGQLLEKFFATFVDDIENSKAWATHKRPDRLGDTSSTDTRGQYSIRFLIATLPQPTSPPLRYLFDSELHALEAAAGTANYYLDSFDLPWLAEGNDLSGSAQVGADPSVAPGADEADRWKRDSGVILFRQEHQLLVVFVIAETPTRGINQVALRDALDQIAWLKGWEDSAQRQPSPYLEAAVKRLKHEHDTLGDPANEVRIVGPAFSGSASSLRNVLEDWRRSPIVRLNAPKDLIIRIVSGTATAIPPGALSVSSDKDSNFPTVVFKTVQIPDSVLWSRIVVDALKLGDGPRETSATKSADGDGAPEIAVLEENTDYGRAANDEEKRGILKMTFPLHISELRSAHQGAQGPGVSAPDLGRQNLALPDEASQQRRDVIPPVSPRAAIYDELLMDNLLTTIRRERIRYVGIVATDVEDLVYLAQQIRAYCPDTVVFTTSADIRFLHSEVNSDLRGMLVIGTYPLFNQLQNWTFPFEGESERKIFSSDLAHGVYNATVALLGRHKSMLDYGAPFVTSPPSPVVQIGVVGRDDIWPLGYEVRDLSSGEVLEINHDLPPQESMHPDLMDGLYPPAFVGLFFILNVGILLCAFALFPKETPLFGLEDNWWLKAFLKGQDSRFRSARNLCAMSLMAGMLIAEIIGLGFMLTPLSVGQGLVGSVPRISWYFWLVLIFEIFTGALVLMGWLSSISGMLFETEGVWLRALYATIGLAPVVLAVGFMRHLWLGTSPELALFAFLRATHLQSGVSPVMALIFLGIAGTALVACHWCRIAMLEDRPLPEAILPAVPEDETASFRGVRRLEKQVTDFLQGSLKPVPAAWLLILILIAAFLYFGLAKVAGASSIDGRHFDILFILLGFGIYCMFSLLLLRFVAVWLALRRLLRRLYFHPSRYSYKNLQLATQPSHLNQQKIRLFEPRPGLTGIEYALGCVRAMIRIAREASDKRPHPNLVVNIRKRQDLVNSLNEAEIRLDALLKQTEWAASVSARTALNATMGKLSGIVTSQFEPVWRKNSPDPRFHVTLRSEDDKITADRMLVEQAELFVAVRVVDFVRHVLPHLINLVGFAMPAVLAMMLAVSVYPFPAHDTLLWVGWTVLLATIFISLYVFIGINRNPILSMITGTDPGQFNWDSTFTMHLLFFAVIPVLTLLGAQYPHALAGMLSWIGSVFGGSSSG